MTSREQDGDFFQFVLFMEAGIPSLKSNLLKHTVHTQNMQDKQSASK